MADPVLDVLAHAPDAEPPEVVFRPSVVEAASRTLDPRLVRWALAVAKQATQEVHDDISPARFDVLADLTGAAIEAISLDVLRYLLEGRGTAGGFRITKAQQATIITAVQEGIPIASVTRGLRLLEREWKRAFIGLIIRSYPPDEAVDALGTAHDRLSRYFDAIIDENARRFNEEANRVLEMQLLGQRQLLERIIAGDYSTGARYAMVLGVEPDATHWCAMVSSRPSAGSSPDFAAYRQAFQREFRDHHAIAVPADRDSIWILASGVPLAASTVSELLRRIEVDAPWAIASFGIARRGQRGIRAAYLSAKALHDYNLARAAPMPVASFADHGLMSLLSADRELAGWFVEREIGPLLADEPLNEEVRKTLLTLLRRNGSITNAAEELYVHRNTITYRLKRAEEILGRDPLARPLEMHVALLLAEQLGTD